MNLNAEQKLVVDAREGAYQVQAGPGSGKSTVLVARYAALLKEGIPPDDLLALSFTKTAAKNLRDKVEKAYGELKHTRTAGPVTFHSLALSFAQEEREVFPFELQEFPLLPELNAYRIAAEAGRKYEVDPRAARSYISLQKRGRVRADDAVKTADKTLDPKQIRLAEAYKFYDTKTREEGLLDFDSLIFEMVELLISKPEVRDRRQYKYVMVDEAQDCCISEWTLLQALTSKNKNIVAVGDPSQAIYEFRGADPELFQCMSGLFPDCKTLYLSANYRSTQEIIDFYRAYGVSEELSSRLHSVGPSGEKPDIQGFRSSDEEAEWVAKDIRNFLNPQQTLF